MGAKKETIKTIVKKGADLGLFQKIYKQFLKIKSPKEAKKAAEAAIKKSQESAKKTLEKGKETAKKIKQTKTDKINEEKIASFGETVKKVKKGAIITGLGTGAGLAADVVGYKKTGESPFIGPIYEKGKETAKKIKKKFFKAKGGSVRRMNAGGSVSRGTGAAIRGTKFKGVF